MNSKALVIAVPTYWTAPGAKVEVIFDHPTPLGTMGPLPRLLQSLVPWSGEFARLVLVAAPVGPDLAEPVEKQLREFLAATALPYPILVVGPQQVAELRRLATESGPWEGAGLLSLAGYGAVRNLTLVVANLLEAELLLALDDDELVLEAGFFRRLWEDFGNLSAQHEVFGLAGLYRNPDGSLAVPEPAEPWAQAWPKLRWLNQAVARLAAGAEPVPSPLALGGNMAFGRSLYLKIPFDPLVPRGEDLDYVLNARMFGITFFLDPRLQVVHDPPPKPHPLWLRLRLDLQRFVYTRQKLRGQRPAAGLVPVTAAELQPYPGNFLGDDLELLAYRSHTMLARAYLERGEAAAAREVLANLDCLERLPDPDLTFAAYLELVHHWQRLQAWLSQPAVRQAALTVLTRLG